MAQECFNSEVRALRQRVAELEAVLRECHNSLNVIIGANDVPGFAPMKHVAIFAAQKIEEVLNVKE